MTTLYQQIAEKFLAELQNSPNVDSQKLGALKLLFADSNKLRPDDLVKVFTSALEDEVK